jgi:hypothetical protein
LAAQDYYSSFSLLSSPVVIVMRPLSLEWSWRQRAKAHAVAQRSLFRIQILRLVCQHCWPYTLAYSSLLDGATFAPLMMARTSGTAELTVSSFVAVTARRSLKSVGESMPGDLTSGSEY